MAPSAASLLAALPHTAATSQHVGVLVRTLLTLHPCFPRKEKLRHPWHIIALEECEEGTWLQQTWAVSSTSRPTHGKVLCLVLGQLEQSRKQCWGLDDRGIVPKRTGRMVVFVPTGNCESILHSARVHFRSLTALVNTRPLLHHDRRLFGWVRTSAGETNAGLNLFMRMVVGNNQR